MKYVYKLTQQQEAELPNEWNVWSQKVQGSWAHCRLYIYLPVLGTLRRAKECKTHCRKQHEHWILAAMSLRMLWATPLPQFHRFASSIAFHTFLYSYAVSYVFKRLACFCTRHPLLQVLNPMRPPDLGFVWLISNTLIMTATCPCYVWKDSMIVQQKHAAPAE